MYPVAGARLPVPRRELPACQLPEDEARHGAHAELSAENQRRLPGLQAADRTLLLPRQTLPRDQVPGAFLRHHQAETAAAAAAAAGCTGAPNAEADGGDARRRHADRRVHSAADSLPAQHDRSDPDGRRKTHHHDDGQYGCDRESRRHAVGRSDSAASFDGAGAGRRAAPDGRIVVGRHHTESTGITAAAFTNGRSGGPEQNCRAPWRSSERGRRRPIHHRDHARRRQHDAHTSPRCFQYRSDSTQHCRRRPTDDGRRASAEASDICLRTGEHGRQPGGSTETTSDSEVAGVTAAATTSSQYTQEQSAVDGNVPQSGESTGRIVISHVCWLLGWFVC